MFQPANSNSVFWNHVPWIRRRHESSLRPLSVGVVAADLPDGVSRLALVDLLLKLEFTLQTIMFITESALGSCEPFDFLKSSKTAS